MIGVLKAIKNNNALIIESSIIKRVTPLFFKWQKITLVNR